MAITIETDLVDVNLVNDVTSYSVLGTWATAIAVSPDTYVQSSSTGGGRVSANTAWAHTTVPYNGSDFAINLTVLERHVFQWLKCISIPQLDSKTNGGLGITLSSDPTPTLTGVSPNNGPTNSKTWYVGGNADALSGWSCYVVDPVSTPDLALGSPDLTQVRRIGIRAKVVGVVGGGSVRPVNVVFDACRYGTGLTFSGDSAGTPGSFADILAVAMDPANAWGILTADNSIYFGAGKHNFGKAAQTAVTSFKSVGELFVWRNLPVAVSFYSWVIRGAASFATTFQLGNYANGLTSNGSTVRGAGDPESTTHATWSLDVGSNCVVNLYGSQFSELYRGTLTPTTTIRSCQIKNFGTITPAGAFIDDCTFLGLKTSAPISATYALVITGVASNLTNCVFVDCEPAILWNVNADTNGKLNGSRFISGGTGHAIELGPNTPSSITVTSVSFSGYGANGTTNAAIYNNSGKAITINVTGGAAPSFLNGTGASTTIVSAVGLTISAQVSLLGAEVRVYDLDNAPAGSLGSELSGTESNSSATYVYSGTGGNEIWVQIFKDGYEEFGQRITMPTADSSFTALLTRESNT